MALRAPDTVDMKLRQIYCDKVTVNLEAKSSLTPDEFWNTMEIIALNNKGMINFKGNILFASHDQELMQTVANRIVELDGTKTFDKLTTYEEYLDQQ